MSTARQNSLARFGSTLLALALAFAWAGPAGPDVDADSLSVRERWARLSPVEREALRERYETYQRLSESEQRELAERAANVRKTRQRLLRRLTDGQRTYLRRLDAEKRDALIEEMVEDELRLQGRRLHALIPEEWRERVENGTSAARERRSPSGRFVIAS